MKDQIKHFKKIIKDKNDPSFGKTCVFVFVTSYLSIDGKN